MRRTLLMLFTLACLFPPSAPAQEAEGEAEVGLHVFGGSLPNCDTDCAAFTAGLFVVQSNGRTIGIDADWLDLSNITFSYGWPTGRVATFLSASFGQYRATNEWSEGQRSTTAGNTLVTTALGVGLGWRFLRLRVLHDGDAALWQMGIAILPRYFR